MIVRIIPLLLHVKSRTSQETEILQFFVGAIDPTNIF